MALFNPPSASPPRRPLQRAKQEVEEFGKLLELKWRTVAVPYASLRTTLDHSLVHHKYYGIDGVNIEDTGLEGLKFEATIPLFNRMAAAPSESWGNTKPFPDLFLKLWEACRDRTTGELQHPLFGPFDCKVQQVVFPLEADKREGAEITVSWVETTPLLDTGESSRYRGGPIAAAKWAAIDLDASMTDLRDKVPDMPVLDETFDSMMNKVAGAIDRVSMAALLVQNKPAQIFARIKRVQQSVERARNPQLWPIVDACERLREALREALAGSSQARPLKTYVTPVRTTLAMVANTLKARIEDLVKLNPALTRKVDIEAGTSVRYFAR